MLVVNFFGAPSTGKSATAASVFSMLKRKGIEVELCSEYAKTLVWAKRTRNLEDSISVFAKQNSILNSLFGHNVDVAITDSPLPLSLVYSPPQYFKGFEPLVMEVFNSYNNFNVYLSPGVKYSSVGRVHSEEESILLDRKLSNIIKKYKLEMIYGSSTEESDRSVVEEILQRLEGHVD